MKSRTHLRAAILGGAALLVASVSVARAQTSVEFIPLAGYRFGGEVQNAFTGAHYELKDGPAYGLMMDVGPTDSHTRLEVLWTRQDSGVDLHGTLGVNNVNVTIDEFQLGAIAEMDEGKLHPYLAGTLGATYFASDHYGSDTKFSFGLGGGVRYSVTKRIELRADLRGFCSVVDSQSSFIYHNGIALVHFSGTSLWQGQASIGVGIRF